MRRQLLVNTLCMCHLSVAGIGHQVCNRSKSIAIFSFEIVPQNYRYCGPPKPAGISQVPNTLTLGYYSNLQVPDYGRG